MRPWIPVRTKSVVAIDCNDSTVAVALRATRTLVPGSARASRAHFGALAEIRPESAGFIKCNVRKKDSA